MTLVVARVSEVLAPTAHPYLWVPNALLPFAVHGKNPHTLAPGRS